MSDVPPEAQDALFALFAVKLDLVSEASVERALNHLEDGQSVREALEAAGKLTAEQAERVQAALDPEVIEGYRIEGEAGRGGMGVVYRARQISMDRLVALKVLTRRLSRDEAYVAKFLEEARSAAKLNHENVVAAIDAGEAEGLYYFVMEFVAGASLADVIDEQGPLEWELALDITEQVARALEHAHQAGLVHRDVKPENILWGEGQAKLCDLGLAKPSQVAGTGEKADMTEGTPYYCSPEQALGRTDIDPRSDVYSLGISLFTMIKGEPPFDGDTPRAILLKQVKQPFPNLDEALPQLPGPYRRLIADMVIKDRAQRLESMRAFMERLGQARGEASGGEGPSAPRARTRRGASPAPIAGVVGLLVVVALVFAFVGGGEEEPDPSPAPTPSVSQVAVKPPPSRPEGPTRVSPKPSQSASGGGDASLRAAKALYDQAAAYAKDKPDDITGQRELFQAVVNRFPGTGYASQAEVRLAGLGEARERQVTRALDALSKQVLELQNSGSVGDALQLIQTFRETWSKRGGAGLEETLSTMEGRVRRQISLLVEKDLSALEAGEADPDARARVNARLEHLPAGLATRARSRLQAIERAAARARWDTLQGEIDQALLRGDLAGARRRVQQAQGDAALQPFAGQLKTLAQDVDQLDKALAAFRRRCESLPKQATLSFALRGGGSVEGRYLDFDAEALRGRFQPRDDQEPRSLHLNELQPSELQSWALPPAQGRANVLLFLLRGLPEAAQLAYTRFRAAGGAGDAALEERIRQARAKVMNARALAALQPLLAADAAPEAVLAGIKQLDPALCATEAYRDQFAALKAAYVRARQAQIAADTMALFHAKEKKERKGRVTLIYDFEDAAQLQDWAPNKALHPAAKVKHLPEAQAMEVSGIVALQARFKPGLLKVELKVGERNRRRPNLNVLLSAPDAGQWQGLLCAAGFAYGDLVNLKIDAEARKNAGIIVDLPCAALLRLTGKAPSRRMPGVLTANPKASVRKGSSVKLTLTRSARGWLKLKIGSRTAWNVDMEFDEQEDPKPTLVSLAPLSSVFQLEEVEVWGELDPEWVSQRSREAAAAEAEKLPAPAVKK